MTLEKQIETSILNFLKLHKVFAWKNESTGIFDPKIKRFRTNRNPHKIKGTADILGIFHGTLLAIEVKSEKGRVSPDQKEFLENIQKQGGIAFVARSIDDVAEELGLAL